MNAPDLAAKPTSTGLATDSTFIVKAVGFEGKYLLQKQAIFECDRFRGVHCVKGLKRFHHHHFSRKTATAGLRPPQLSRLVI